MIIPFSSSTRAAAGKHELPELVSLGEEPGEPAGLTTESVVVGVVTTVVIDTIAVEEDDDCDAGRVLVWPAIEVSVPIEAEENVVDDDEGNIGDDTVDDEEIRMLVVDGDVVVVTESAAGLGDGVRRATFAYASGDDDGAADGTPEGVGKAEILGPGIRLFL
jgi:hypothetical protein